MDQDLHKAFLDKEDWAVDVVARFITPIVKAKIFHFDNWEDVRQHCLLEIFKYLQDGHEVTNLWGLARKIAVCSTIDFNRRLRIEERSFLGLQSQGSGSKAWSSREEHATPLDHSRDFENRDFFLWIFEQLDKTCQRIFSLLFLEELTHAEAASTLNITEGNLRVRLNRCRRKATSLRDGALEES